MTLREIILSDMRDHNIDVGDGSDEALGSLVPYATGILKLADVVDELKTRLEAIAADVGGLLHEDENEKKSTPTIATFEHYEIAHLDHLVLVAERMRKLKDLG